MDGCCIDLQEKFTRNNKKCEKYTELLERLPLASVPDSQSFSFTFIVQIKLRYRGLKPSMGDAPPYFYVVSEPRNFGKFLEPPPAT